MKLKLFLNLLIFVASNQVSLMAQTPATNEHARLAVNPGPRAKFRAETAGAPGLTSNSFTAARTGDGAGLSNVNATALSGLGSADFWQLNGNLGTSPGPDFIGTTDNQPFELHVNGLRALRLEPNNGEPNLIGGGSGNAIEAGGEGGSAIEGGDRNLIQAKADHSIIGGGSDNQILSSGVGSFVGGGSSNAISAPQSTISGGAVNAIQSGAYRSTISGGAGNTIHSAAYGSVISGGHGNDLDAIYTTIGGGNGNSIQAPSGYATISGGGDNRIMADSAAAGIAGGSGNVIQSDSANAAIGGGYLNTIQTNDDFSIIAGGRANTIQTTAPLAGIGSGLENSIEAGASNSFIGGGSRNALASTASVIGGGRANTIQTGALCSTIGGGERNLAQGDYATIPGGAGNTATNWAFAAGRSARALHPGAFVWADSQTDSFSSTAQDQVSFRCQGGVVFSGGAGGPNQVVKWSPGNAGWSFSSDRNLKDRVEAVDAQSVLARVARLPLAEWNYQGCAQRHIGPMAEDFHSLFPLNDNEKMLNDADLHGVALAAIQGLDQKLESQAKVQGEQMKQKDAEIEQLKRQVAELKELVLEVAAGKSAVKPPPSR